MKEDGFFVEKSEKENRGSRCDIWYIDGTMKKPFNEHGDE